MSGPIVWCEGIIGAGKSTLTAALSKALNLRPLYEPVDSNPYLQSFYEDPKRWSFPMQIELLHRRYAMQQLAAFETVGQGGWRGAVLDRGLPGDRVFARMLTEDGYISDLEWGTYESFYEVMTRSLRPPSLIVFLDCQPEVALERIRKRARGAEANMSLEYLQRLQRGYYDLLVEIQSGDHDWARGMDVLRVPWNTDFMDPKDIVREVARRCRVDEVVDVEVRYDK